MRLVLATLSAALLSTLSVVAQDFPSKSVELVVPWPPGGATDLIARIVADEMETTLGQAVVVVNKPGAGGMVGSGEVAKAKPDGYTILMAGAGTFYRDYLSADTPFDPKTAFVSVSGVAEAPFVVLASPNFDGETIADLVAQAKAQPDVLNLASSGIGSTSHLIAEYFQTVTGTELTHIPYEGASPATLDLLASRVDVFFDSITTATENVSAGAVKALAVSSAERAPLLADVPSLTEAGVEVVASPWWVFAAPAGTPAEAVEALNAAANAALGNPDVVKRLNELGGAPIVLNPAEVEEFVASERAKWGDIITAAGLSIL